MHAAEHQGKTKNQTVIQYCTSSDGLGEVVYGGPALIML